VGDVRFEGVGFEYEDGRPVLDDFSAEMLHGEVVALVGPSGAGKSTIVNLVPRFYDVQRGRITVDAVDIANVRLGDLRDAIAIVPQETQLFNGTIADNIRYGRLNATDAEILAISCEKGGTSVLADLYLVAGRASASEERFAFGYGVALQLLDDLQDVESDLAAGHQTLFTRAARCGALDAPASRLARFIDRVLDGEEWLARPEVAERQDLIRRNCRTLLVGAVAEQPRRFSRRFRRTLARRWPFAFRAMRRLRRRAAKRYQAAAARQPPGSGAASPLDRLLAQED